MPRAVNEEQAVYEFSCNIKLRINDINFAGHVGNSQMIAIAHDARISLLKDLRLLEQNLGDGKTGIVIADITANFKAEIFLRDTVTVKSHIGETGKSGFRIFHRVESNGGVAAFIETGIVAFDYVQRKSTQIPEEFFEALNNYLKGR